MMKSEIVLKSALQDAAITLLMVGPSREFAAGVAAVCSSFGVATPAMLDIIKSRWPEWTVIE
ncbi:MAG: hypothetical protein KDI12_05135 [Anaerolineae bacterium]|nr:hypothetical protein [Anaerolineae bacterium]